MPYKSTKQRGKFRAMADRGEISQSTVEHWDQESKGKKLPEYAGKKGGGKAAKWARRRAKG